MARARMDAGASVSLVFIDDAAADRSNRMKVKCTAPYHLLRFSQTLQNGIPRQRNRPSQSPDVNTAERAFIVIEDKAVVKAEHLRGNETAFGGF